MHGSLILQPAACSLDGFNLSVIVLSGTVIEGDALADKLELIVHEVHFEATVEGGSKNKMTTKYHSKGDVVIKEKLLKATSSKTLMHMLN